MDTSGPIATNCGDVLVLRPGRKERPKGPSTSCRVLRDDGRLLLVAVGASQGWSASLLSFQPWHTTYARCNGVYVEK